MNEIPWGIINGLCRGIGIMGIIILICGKWGMKEIINLGIFVLASILLILTFGKFMFGG